MTEPAEDDAWSRALRAASAVAALGLVAWAIWRMHDTLVRFDRFVHDDVYITLRYAQHVLDGNGPVWNPGERVEGYTSPAALAGISLLGLLRVDLLVAARGLDVAGVALLAASVGWFAWQRAEGPLRPLAAAIPFALAVTNAPLLLWVQGGLEAPLVTGVIAWALALVARSIERPHDRPLALLAALALGAVPLVRPDGIAVVLAGVVAWAVSRRGRRWDSVRFAAWVAALPALHLAFRVAYYGSAIPNAVRVKAMGLPPNDLWASGRTYLTEFLTAPPWVAGTGAIVALALLGAPSTRRLALLLLAAGGLHALGIAAVGGDHMVAHRLLLPVLGPALLAMAVALAAATGVRSARHLVALLGFVLVGGAGVRAVRAQDDAYPSLPMDDAAYVGTIIGDWLAENEPPGTLVALNTAGSTPYRAADLRFVDMLGVNDAHIARREITELRMKFQAWPGHAKGDGDYVLSRDPDIVIIGPAEGRPVAYPWFLGDLELKEDPRFAERYRMRKVSLPVRHLPDWSVHFATRHGTLVFTWYERIRTDAGP